VHAQVIEYLTKFATVRMAMTGQRFFDAGRSVVDLLARNAMDTLGVWWLPPLILQVHAAAEPPHCCTDVGHLALHFRLHVWYES